MAKPLNTFIEVTKVLPNECVLVVSMKSEFNTVNEFTSLVVHGTHNIDRNKTLLTEGIKKGLRVLLNPRVKSIKIYRTDNKLYIKENLLVLTPSLIEEINKIINNNLPKLTQSMTYEQAIEYLTQ